MKQFQGKKCAPEKRKEQPSAIKQFFKGFDFGKSEGKDRRETEETEISNGGADDQSEKQDLSVEGNAGTIMRHMCMCKYYNFIENQPSSC